VCKITYTTGHKIMTHEEHPVHRTECHTKYKAHKSRLPVRYEIK